MFSCIMSKASSCTYVTVICYSFQWLLDMFGYIKYFLVFFFSFKATDNLLSALQSRFLMGDILSVYIPSNG